jgi:hypothetical protein
MALQGTGVTEKRGWHAALAAHPCAHASSGTNRQELRATAPEMQPVPADRPSGHCLRRFRRPALQHQFVNRPRASMATDNGVYQCPLDRASYEVPRAIYSPPSQAAASPHRPRLPGKSESNMSSEAEGPDIRVGGWRPKRRHGKTEEGQSVPATDQPNPQRPYPPR